MKLLWPSATLALSLVLATPSVRGQGFFTNFETPQTHPVEVASINGSELVLVCNAPDDSLEIWTATNAPQLLDRIRVGLGPGTVRWNPTLQRAFVCNFEGDSVSIISFIGSGTSITGFVERAAFVGDEPADIAFNSNSTNALVTLGSRSQVQYFNPSTLALGVNERLDVTFMANNGQFPQPTNPLPLAVKMPRAVAWLPSSATYPESLFALNLMGGEEVSGGSLFYDVDLWRKDAPTGSGSTPSYLGRMGTTNHAFAVSSDRSRIFVVGTRARNLKAAPLSAVRAEATGFVQSWLWSIDVPATGNMVVRAEALTGATPPPPPGYPAFPSFNLNRDYSSTGAAVAEVNSSLGISQPTDIDLFESGGTVTRIAVTGFHSDNIALLTPLPGTSSTPGGYTIARVSFTPASTYSTVGPRGLAYNAAGTLLFVHGRLDSTLRVVDTSSMAVTTRNMQDPTTSEIRQGRQFLYSTLFSRAVQTPGGTRGFVSCASCHVDGRTDGLLWDLSGDHGAQPLKMPPLLQDLPVQGPEWPGVKGVKITQTLQGLVNYLTNETFQFLATNAPYHWRGDKAGFVDFNEAFVNLQGMPNVAPVGQPERGLSDLDMVGYRRFINTIRHAPNPEQSVDRVVTGLIIDPATGATSSATVGNPHANLQNPLGSGSLLGRSLFVNAGNVACGSCVSCHSLPDGSSNTITEAAGIQPVETAALRNIFQREMTLHTSSFFDIPTGITYPVNLATLSAFAFPGTAFVNNRGLTSDGIASGVGFSIHTFVASAPFIVGMPALVNPFSTTQQELLDIRSQIQGLIQFTREFDSGVAPMIGRTHTVNNSLGNTGANLQSFDQFEAQARQANVGLGVRVRASSGGHTGFWFDPQALPPNGGYRQAGVSTLTAPLTRASLLSTHAVSTNIMVLQATPLGGDRRWAAPNGVGVAIIDTTNSPANLLLEEMAPATFLEGLTDLNLGINPLTQAGTTLRRLSELHTLVSGSFGVPALRRHEPSRRIRFSGTNIRTGARAFLFMYQFNSSNGSVELFPLGMDMLIFPTRFTAANGNAIWETELELDQLQTFTLLAGGPFDQRVRAILDATIGNSSNFQSIPQQVPNQYSVLVLNEDGTWGITPQPMPLRIRDVR